MKNIKWFLLTLFSIGFSFSQAQKVDSVKFFAEEAIIDMTLTTDIPQIQKEKGEDMYQAATISLRFPDSSVIEEPVTVAPRGHFRREYCNIPPIMVDFSNAGSPRLSPLGKLKLVIGCGTNGNDEQLVLREYLIYKMYNLLTDKSFKVRLLNLTCEDYNDRKKSFTRYAFLLEDVDAMAKRNSCREMNNQEIKTESTNKK